MMDFNFDAAIFDMDGTMLDTMRYWRFTGLEYALHHGWPILPDVISRMYGVSARKIVYEYAERAGAKIEDHMEMVHELEGYMHRHYLYDANLKDPALPAFLETLKSRGVRMCVATGAPREYAKDGLSRLGILKYFDFVTDNYESEHSKEKPGYFDWVMGRLGVSADRCWVFEDALYAMKSAKASGLRVCAIEDDAQISEREDIKALADVYIRSYSELMG